MTKVGVGADVDHAPTLLLQQACRDGCEIDSPNYFQNFTSSRNANSRATVAGSRMR